MRIFLRVFGKKAMPFTPCRVYIGTEAGGETHRFRTGWKAHTERNAAAKDGSDEMPVSMQAEQTITQFLELLSAFRLKEAGELVFEDIWYDIPGTDWLEGRVASRSWPPICGRSFRKAGSRRRRSGVHSERTWRKSGS